MEEEDDLTSSATWQESIIEKSITAEDLKEVGKSDVLEEKQLVLANFIEKSARCISETQIKGLRAPFVDPSDKCGVCGTSFWTTAGMTIPNQRHHCYCCGKALCNACTISVDMENGHRSPDGHYVKDFVWNGKFCIDHDLITGETKEAAKEANGSGWSIIPKGPLAWLGFLVRIGGVVVSVFPVVSTLGTMYAIGKPLYWTYKVVRIFV